MARFCASCGTACEAGASFCNQCGHALKKPAARSAATAAPASQARAPVDGPPPARSGTRRLPWALGLGLTLVVALGGGVGGWMYYDSQRAPNAEAQQAIASRWLENNRARLLQQACLGNFAYDRPRVFVAPGNEATRQWLQPLVESGVYAYLGQNEQGSLVYEHGPQARRYIRDGKLCLADSLRLGPVRVEANKPESTLPRIMDKVPGVAPMAWLQFELLWEGKAPFATVEPIAKSAPKGLTQPEVHLVVQRVEGAWKELGREEWVRLKDRLEQIESAAEGAPQRAQGQAPNQARAAAQGGWSSGLGKWLSFGGASPDSVADAFSRAIAKGDAGAALAHVHPDQRNADIEANLRMIMDVQRTTLGQAGVEVADVNTRVEQQDDSAATVAVVLTYSNSAKASDRVRLGRHEGQWYVLVQ